MVVGRLTGHVTIVFILASFLLLVTGFSNLCSVGGTQGPASLMACAVDIVLRAGRSACGTDGAHRVQARQV